MLVDGNEADAVKLEERADEVLHLRLGQPAHVQAHVGEAGNLDVTQQALAGNALVEIEQRLHRGVLEIHRSRGHRLKRRRALRAGRCARVLRAQEEGRREEKSGSKKAKRRTIEGRAKNLSPSFVFPHICSFWESFH